MSGVHGSEAEVSPVKDGDEFLWSLTVQAGRRSDITFESVTNCGMYVSFRTDATSYSSATK